MTAGPCKWEGRPLTIRLRTKPGFKNSVEQRATTHWFSIVAANGRILTHSEQYTTKAARDKAVERITERSLPGAYRVVDVPGRAKW